MSLGDNVSGTALFFKVCVWGEGAWAFGLIQKAYIIR